MKRSIVSVITALSVLLAVLTMTGCPSITETPETPDGPALYAKDLWGEWLRMDTGETWYISSSAIKVDSQSSSKSVSLSKQSDRVIEVSEVGRKYYLYASRVANTSFTGKIASFDAPTLSRAVDGLGGIDITIANLTDKANTVSAATDADGKFIAEGIIPGDTYRITPQGGTPVTVTPRGNGDDIGTITITEGVNFKTSIKASDDDDAFFYANDEWRDFTIEVTNTGTEDCFAATYQLMFEDGLVTTASTEKARWGTIEPGASKTIDLSLKCDTLESESAYKKIAVTIADEINQKTWEDSVSVKFYKVPVYFYLETESSAAAPVSGVVINPYDSKASRFQMVREGMSYVTMPWSTRGYLVVFSGATVETEAVYALSANRFPPYSASDFSGFTDLGRYEPNDTEQTADEVTDESMMAYLHKNDIDYYHYLVTEPEGGVLPDLYTVTFNTDGGSPAAETRTVLNENLVGVSNMPADPTKILYVFDGWYTAPNGGGTQFTASTIVTGNLTVYAKWTSLSFNDALTWIGSNAVEGGAYIITIKNDKAVVPKTLSYSGKNVNITIMGDTAERTVYLYSSGSLFTVESGVTLTLDNNITLMGDSNNTASLITVSGGSLVMNAGSKISGNTSYASSSSSYGGGVYVGSGTFTMNGGTISGNTSYASSYASYGGGVYVGGTFTMNGGTISDNTGGGVGGGVSVGNNRTFTMSGGTISGNTASYGGGVYVGGTFSTFTMSGGTISGNTASYGGGVYVGGTFTKSGGIIYGSDADLKNTARNGNSNAVYVSNGNGSKKRNTTAGEGVTLDSTKSGSAGGWE